MNGQPLCDISVVLLFEGVAIVFHVTRQKDFFVVPALGNGKARIFRFTEHNEVADLFHVLHIHGGMAGMRNVKDVVDAL